MRTRRQVAVLTGLLAAWLAPGAPVPAPPEPAPAQETASLELTASTDLEQQMRDAPGDLSWQELAGHLTVRFTAGEILDRAPIRVVAVAVRDGEIVGRAFTPPGLASAGQPKPCSELAEGDWPPVDRWFSSPAWTPAGLETVSGQLAPDPERVASGAAPGDADGAVVLFAVPAADELLKRFSTRPLVIRMESTGAVAPDTAGPDTVAPDTVAPDTVGR